jgi:hypothetical protein
MVKSKKINKNHKINTKKGKFTLSLKQSHKTKTRKYKTQRGGNQEYAYITTISNSGRPRDTQSSGMGSQCMWVSISDYFKYALNQDISVMDLKIQSGLKDQHISPYCGIEFDQNTPELNESMDKLCIKNDINLNIFLNYNHSTNFKINYIDDNGNKSLIPSVKYNITGRNTINILNTPGHFELITKILINKDSIYELQKNQYNNIPYTTKTHKIKTDSRANDDNTDLIHTISLSLLESVIKDLNNQIQTLCIKSTKDSKLIKDIYIELKFAKIQKERYEWEISTKEQRLIMAEIVGKCQNINTDLLINYNVEDLEKLKNLKCQQIKQILNELSSNLSATKFKELLDKY